MKHTVYTILLLFTTGSAFGQHELGLHFMRNVWQSDLTNPAFVQPQTILVSVLGLRNNLLFDGPTYNEIVTEENGQTTIDVDRFVDKLNAQNFLRDDLELSTLRVGLHLGNLYLGVGHAVRYHAFLKYPKELPQIVWQGNAQFIGQTIPLGNEVQLTGYHELSLGAAYKLGKLTVGGRVKLLSGINNASTDENHHDASIFTDTDVYQITLSGDYVLNTAGAVKYDGFTDLDVDFDYGNYTFDKFFSKNSGVALDLGAVLKLDKLELAFSVLDLGKITWDERVTNYSATQTVTYDGLDFSMALTGDSTGNFEDALDTLRQLFKVEETHDSYTTELPGRAYLSAMYRISERTLVGALVFTEKFRGERTNRFAVGASAGLLPALTVGASYAVGKDSYDNLGLNASFRIGPVQLFAVTDNVFAALQPGDSKDFSVRLGGSVLFGQQKDGS